jgi:hypothetical protein
VALSLSRLFSGAFWSMSAVILGLAFASESQAQTGTLPKGIGLYQFGYRVVPKVDTKYGPDGASLPLGEDFDMNFSGPALLGKDYGKDLQRLATVLKEYEGGAAGPGSLLGDLALGRLNGDVVANVNAKIFALGFGVSDSWTLFVGIPWITAEVTTELSFSGDNNALQILERLGEAAFDELRDGLQRASRVSLAEIEQNLAVNGFQPVDRWSHSGMGDLRLGAKTSIAEKLASASTWSLDVTTTLDLPTGYVERPDILTDINFGKSWASLAVMAENTFLLSWLLLGVDATWALNFNASHKKRLPEGDELTVSAERTKEVRVNPGDDIDLGSSVGANVWWLTPRYRLGLSRHFADRWSGSMPGNYKKLSESSDTSKLYHELSLNFDTTKAYERSEFSLPFVLAFKAHIPLEGKNTPIQEYYEVSLSSFFPTPLADRRPEPKAPSGR